MKSHTDRPPLVPYNDDGTIDSSAFWRAQPMPKAYDEMLRERFQALFDLASVNQLSRKYRAEIDRALTACFPDLLHDTARTVLSERCTKHPTWGIDEVLSEIYSPDFQQAVIKKSTEL